MPGRLHGRRREVELVDGALAAAAAGRGRVVAVEGPAGIGKSSLLAHVRGRAQAGRFAVAIAHGSELETAFAWGIVRQLLEPRLRGMPPAARERALAGAAALASPIVLPETAPPDGGADAPAGVLHGLYWLVAGLAAQRPQLLAVDDLHWADAASAGFLGFLANRIADLPVLLVTAQRPGGALPGAAPVERIELGALSLEASAALLAERGDEVSAAFAAACHEATGGNPLLLRRLADGLRGTADPAEVARLGPGALARTVDASLTRLGDAALRLARAVAVLGTAPLFTAARLAGLAPDASAALADRLVRAGILRDARPLEFAHALVREAVLEGLTAGGRADLHRAAATVLTETGAGPDAVAAHLLHAEPRGAPAVAAALASAGRRALAAGAPEEARALLARALLEPPPAGDRPALLLELARAEHALGDPAATAHVLEAHEAATDAAGRARAALALSWAGGPGVLDPERAVALVEDAIADLDGTDRDLALELEAVRHAAIFMSTPLLQATLGEAERFAGLEGVSAAECALLPVVAMHRFLLGRAAAEVAEPVERAVARPEVVAAIGPDSFWLQAAMGQLFKCDRLEAARRTMEVASAESQRRGSATGFAMASVWRAWIALREGRAADAEADARVAREALPAGMWQRVFCDCCLIEVLVERGGLDEASGILEAAMAGRAGAGDRASEFMLYARSILCEARGEPAPALEAQLESRRLRGGGRAPDPDFDGWLRIARLRHAIGDGAGAREEADAALAWARGWATPAYVGQALTASGLVHDDLDRLREAIERLERSSARRELARSLVALGAALRRRGERVAAREPLRRALDLAASGGMTATGGRAREELALTGARVRRAEATGLASLTPSERRIVDLAAAGASNPEIAQALFVTVKTVEMHLGHAYRKLGVASRHELAPVVAAG